MKTSQIVIAFMTTSLAIFAWTYVYWNIVNPVEMAYKTSPTQVQFETINVEPKTGDYLLFSISHPELTGKLSIVSNTASSISNSVQTLVICMAFSFFACLLMVIGNLQRGSYLQRFVVIMIIGLIQTLQFFIPEFFWSSGSWKILMLTSVYNIIFWLIIALAMTFQMGIKKRNIFRNK